MCDMVHGNVCDTVESLCVIRYMLMCVMCLQVSDLTAELEKERSKVHSFKSELDKLKVHTNLLMFYHKLWIVPLTVIHDNL